MKALSLQATAPRSDTSSLTLAVKQEALRLGFTAVGITSAENLHSRRAELQRWLTRGHSGGLGYMERFFSRQTQMLAGFQDLRGIIVLAAAYGPGRGESRPSTGPAGRVARYAQGRDYHRALRKRIRLLESALRALAGDGVRTLHSVDKGPIQERALAEAAGIGFIGKNTMLIHPKAGSFVFLAVILTNLEFEPEAPLQQDCGSCTLCIEACPTNALVEPYHLDAGRCISNLTIENRGAIPAELRAGTKDWVFGCDICQEVCPYNRARTPARWPEFSPKSGAGALLSLESLLVCRTEEEFHARFAGTPLMRAKRPGLLRNAAVAAGNSGLPELIQPLKDLLRSDPDPMVREHAAWALGRLNVR